MDGSPSVHAQLVEKVRSYRMPQAAQELLTNHPPLIVAGITASGKNSVTQYIIESNQYRRVITHTTRQARASEVHGQHYYFVSEEEMLRLLDNEAMIEVQTIHSASIYGVSIRAYQDVISSGYRSLIILDVQGIEEVGKYLPALRAFFLLPPDFHEWMARLEKRGPMSHSERLRRMHSARTELEKALNSHLFWLVVNHEIPAAAREILSGASDFLTQHKNREAAQQLLDHLRTT